MLLEFSVKNWMSFKDEEFFSLIATRERQHRSTLAEIKKYRMSILPIASFYGGNASGKTNLISAIAFAKHLVEKGTEKEELIGTEPFNLDRISRSLPTEMKFLLLIDETIYEYSFSVTDTAVIGEKLTKITSTSEYDLFVRKNSVIKFFDPSINSEDEQKFFLFSEQTMRDNQLFITHATNLNIDKYQFLYDWFKKDLNIISPNTMFGAFNRYVKYPELGNLLNKLDTGITEIKDEQIPIENVDIPTEMIEDIFKKLGESKGVTIKTPTGDSYDIVKYKNKLICHKQVTYHQAKTGEKVMFERRQESEGTLRLLDLLPIFIDISLKDSKSVFIIDELDRSLHSLLTRKLIDSYLGNCDTFSRTQLLFTTHDVFLMDQNIFRRDEMFVVERESSGNSVIIPLSDFKELRYDKNIRKSYYEGRLGGIPNLLIADIIA